MEGNYWKLGLFVVVAVGLLIGAAFWLGAATLRDDPPVRMVTWFDESVQGLSIGSDVRFRGVRIGEVESIRVADDMVHLEVVGTIQRGALEHLETAADASARLPQLIPDLYVELSSMLLTGQKYVAMDVATPEQAAAARLPAGMASPAGVDVYVPSRRSTLKNVEDAVENALVFFQDLGPELGTTVRSLAQILQEIHDARLPDEIRTTLTNADAAIQGFNRRLDQIDAERLGEGAGRVLDDVALALGELHTLLRSFNDDQVPETRLSRSLRDFLDVTRGEVEAAQLQDTATAVRVGSAAVTRAADAVTRAADEITLLGDDLGATLRSLRETIDVLSGLIAVLEHDPSSILRGRTYGAPPPPTGKDSD